MRIWWTTYSIKLSNADISRYMDHIHKLQLSAVLVCWELDRNHSQVKNRLEFFDFSWLVNKPFFHFKYRKKNCNEFLHNIQIKDIENMTKMFKDGS